MMVKKFIGTSTRDVLRQVREQLGPDALILSNRQLQDGRVEITAVADSDIANLGQSPAPAPRPVVAPVSTAQVPPSPARKANLQRTYALPPEVTEEDEPTIASIRGGAFTAPRQIPSEPPATPDPIPRNFNVAAVMAQAKQQSQVHASRERESEPMFASAPAPQQEEPLSPAMPLSAVPPRVADPSPVVPANMARIDSISTDVEEISSEIRVLRKLLEGQLAGLAWNELKRNDPERIEVLRRLLAVGFSPALSRQIVDKMPAGYTTERGMKWARTALQHNIPTVGPGADIVETGGVFALVGPTGVGKTTTVAKIAARATLKHGPQQVALITTDGYRVGAQDQLRIYGKILGIPVHAVTDEDDLQRTLASLGNRHLVLVDTVGMSQRDQRLVEQIALLTGHTGADVKRLLLLSANAQGTTLEDVVRRYHGKGLTGCIFTKVDEAFSLGSGLDVIIRYRLPLYYITNGQRVPEDLHVASALYLVDRVFKTPPEAPAWRLKSEEYPVFLGARQELDFSWREAG
ncbi:flagellar biosynthesis protein FlhF [Burkholderiaceae bacterium DAT-1]|nr:flagellar biosynthesis protein FlhF [Burkholderiaceae bacterium DAT-1]